MELTQKYTMDAKQIMITFDFIDNMERDTIDVDWNDIIYLMERLNNDIENDTSLGHVFHKNGNAIFIELYFEIDKDNSYIVDHYEHISSDRYLDLMLDGRKLELAEKPIREIL